MSQLGRHPSGVDVNPNTKMVYVTNQDSNTVSIIDGKTNNVVKTALVGKSPFRISVDEKTNKVYVANKDGNTISVIDGSNTNNNVRVLFQLESQLI